MTLKQEEQIVTHIDSFGIWDVSVVQTDDQVNGLKANFMIAANRHNGGTVKEIVQISSKSGARVDFSWSSGQQHPRIKFADTGLINEPIDIKILFRKVA